MYWMLGGLNDWNGSGRIKLDALVDLNNKCAGKSGGAAGAGQVSGNYMLQHQGFRTWIGENNGVSEQQIQIAKQKASYAGTWAANNGMKDLGLENELVAGYIQLKYRLDAKSLYSPFDALDISFRSNNRSGQKHVLDSSWTQAKSMSRSVPWPGIKALGYVSDLVVGSAAGLSQCSPTETSGSSNGSLVGATITLKSLDKLKSAHTQFLN